MDWTLTCACEEWQTSADSHRTVIRRWEAHLRKGQCSFQRRALEKINKQQNLFSGEQDEMINRERYAGTAVLRAADLKDNATYTIDWFQEIKSQLRDRPIQPAVRLNGFEEPLPLNTTNLDALMEAFGENEENWKGKKVLCAIIDVQTPDGTWTKGVRLTPAKQAKSA
jgi:hypothetical protein